MDEERSEIEKVYESQQLFDLVLRVTKLEQRIDRLVEAVDKSKSVRKI